MNPMVTGERLEFAAFGAPNGPAVPVDGLLDPLDVLGAVVLVVDAFEEPHPATVIRAMAAPTTSFIRWLWKLLILTTSSLV
jgi:hypothetical protein